MKCGACDGLWYTQKAATLDAKINIKSLKLKTSSAWIVCDNLSLDRWFSICLWYRWFVAKQKKGNWFVCWLRAFIHLSVRSVVSGGQSTFAIALCFRLIIATHVFSPLVKCTCCCRRWLSHNNFRFAMRAKLSIVPVSFELLYLPRCNKRTINLHKLELNAPSRLNRCVYKTSAHLGIANQTWARKNSLTKRALESTWKSTFLLQ